MYKSFHFKCKKCQEVQEQLVSNEKGKAEDPCAKCGAEAKDLKKIIANPASGHGRHVSWGKWSI